MSRAYKPLVRDLTSQVEVRTHRECDCHLVNSLSENSPKNKGENPLPKTKE